VSAVAGLQFDTLGHAGFDFHASDDGRWLVCFHHPA